MLPTKNQLRTQSKSLTHRFAKWSTPFVMVSLVALMLFATHVSSNSVKSTAAITVHAAGRGKPWLNMQDGRELNVDYQGERAQTEALRSGWARPLTLATGDFDLDGAPDLLTGYATPSGGIVTLQRGNIEAFAPRDSATFKAIQEGRMPPSFLPTVDTFSVPDSPDFLQVGDFNGDGFKDVLAAARGGYELYLLSGNGEGGLDAPERVDLPGSVTALTTGLFNRGRVSDVAVGINGPDGPSVMVFDGGSGGLWGAPLCYSLPAEATSLELGHLDKDSFFDLAVAAGQEVDIIHGQGIQRAGTIVDSNSRIERLTLPFTARALTLGEFIWDRDNRKDLAVLAADGTIHVLQPGDLDTRPFTPAELAALGAQQERDEPAGREVVPETVAPAWQQGETAAWKVNDGALQAAAVATDGSVAQSELVASPISYRSAPDLLVLDSGHRQLGILRQIGDQLQSAKSAGSLTPDSQASVALDTSSEPVAVLPMPRKVNGERDLMLLTKGSVGANDIIVSPLATITVDRTDDNAAASGCTGAANDCSLRGAVTFANANAGTTISIPAGTYTLSIAGAGENLNATGDLDLIASGTSITGAGAATTIINNTTGDRTFQFSTTNVSLWTGSISGVTVQNTNTSVNATSGGVMLCGGADNTITVTSCTFNNNQISGAVASNGAAISHASFANSDAGDMTVTSSTFTNNSVANGVGGAIRVLASAGTGVGTPSDTITLCTFDNNQATTNEGGALFLTGGNTGTYTINKCTFTNNKALIATAGSGGGAIQVSNGNMTASFSRFFKNSANAGGSGNYSVKVSGNGTNNVSNNWWGCNGDPQTPASGCDVLINTGAGTFTISNRLQLRNTISGANVHNGNQIAPSSTATFTADILGLSGGGSTAAGNLTSLAAFPIPAGTIYSNAALGTIPGNTTQFTSGVAPSITYSAGATKGTGSLDATADNQTVTTQVVIGFTPEFVNPAGNDNVASAFSSAACGAGNTPCFATVGAALFNVAVSGTINIQAGTYAETPDFNQNCTTNITGNVGLNSATLTNGTFNASSFTTTLASGNFTNNGGVFTQATSTFAFTPGAGAQTIGGSNATTFNSLTINNVSGVNLGNNVTVGGTLTLTNGALGVGTNTLTLNSTVSFTNGTITSAATGTVNYNQGSNGQAIAPGSYGNLTFSNFNKTLPPSGTVGIANVFTTGSAVGHTITGSTVDFNGTGAQTVPAFNYNNLTISNARTGANNVTLVNGGTIGVAGAFSPTATFGTGNYVNAGNTFNFNGTGAQTVPAFNYNNLTISGARTGANNVTLVNGGTIGVAGAFSPTATFGTGNYVNAGNTFDFNGTGAQTIPALGTVGYNNLTISGARTGANSVTLVNGGTILIAGVFSPTATFGTGNYVTTNNTVNFGSTGAQTIPALGTASYNNLTISGARTTNNITLVNGGTIRISAVFSPTATFTSGVYVLTGNTIEYNGGALQTLPSSGFNTYNNLTINNTVGATGFAGLTVNGLLDVAKGTFTSSSTYNNVQVDNLATLAGTAATTINVTGNWAINTGGAFTPNGNTVNFNGSGAQTIGGTATTAAATTFSSLTIANAGSGVTLGQNETVNGTLTLTNDLNTSTFTLTQPSTAPASAGAGDVVGNIKRTGAPLPQTALTYGNLNNTISFTAVGTRPTDITVKLTKTAPTDAATGQTNSGWPAAILRTYLITPTGGSGFSATMQLHYNAGDLNGNTAGNLKLWKLIANGWSEQSASTDNGSGVGVSLSGLTGFSPWTMADTVVPTAANGNVSGQIFDSNGNPVEGAAVRMSGTQNRLTVTDAAGNYRFDDVDTNGFYTVVPTRSNFTFSPSQRAFSQLGQHTEAAFSATSTGGGLNPLNTTEYFVRQQYVDFLGREPDESGFNFWVNNIDSCGTDTNCHTVKRIDTSAAFFLSLEFQQTGYLVYRTYQAAYGNLPNAPVPIRLNEFRPDTQEIGNGVIVLQSGWEQQLESNKQAYVAEFVQRPRFVLAYPTTMTPAEFVDRLFTNAGVTPGGNDRMAAINEFGLANTTTDVAARGRALRRVAENSVLAQQKFNQAFVLMEYFGYLGRDANSGPDTDFSGYNFWLDKLNTFGGNFQNADMVKAFLVSSEYNGRFPR